MFDWEGCPLGLFDLYMEVGAVKPAGAETADCVYLEIWVGSSFSKEHIRPECEDIRRRPIYGILKQILKLCAQKRAGLIFLCDDAQCRWGNDTSGWSSAIFLLLKELEKRGKLAASVMFTKHTLAQILEQGSSIARDQERAEYNGLYEMLDVLITCQANRYSDSALRTVIAYNREILAGLGWLLDEQEINNHRRNP